MKLPWSRKPKPLGSVRWGLPPLAEPKRDRSYLVAIAIGTVIAWQLPYGQLLLYPFTILATWFHEMGHGLASMLLGASFDQLVIFSDGSGYARSSWRSDAPGVFHALTSAAGLLGPAIAGASMIAVSRSERATRTGLYVLGGLILLSTAIWVRSLFGWIVLPPIGLIVLAIAARGSAGLRKLAMEFLGIQAAISIWRDIHYLYSDGATVGGVTRPSDTAAIAEVLILPYWFWGTVITAAIVALIWKALAYASRP